MKQFNYKLRQENFFNLLPDSESSISILLANPILYRSYDTEYPYRPNSDILYFIGFEEPESILVFVKRLSGDENKIECSTILFVQPKDPEKETRTGRRIGVDKAKEKFQVSDSFVNTEFEKWFIENSQNVYRFYHNLNGFNKLVDRCIISKFSKSNIEGILINPIKILSELRTVKDELELEIIKKSTEIAAQAHIKAMENVIPNIKESDIANLLLHNFKDGGASGEAYNSIVASGDNATILHYVTNKDTCKDGDLLLLDAGCEYQYYASDITRTFPINGKFTDIQKKIYELVLNAQKISINLCKVGSTWEEINNATIRSLTLGLIKLGVLEGDLDILIKDEKYIPYFMHSFGHSIGLDTHDPSNFKSKTVKGEFKRLKAGTILTVEPGLYFSSSLEDIPDEYKGIGIRIEDNVLITKNGPIILTASVPKEINEIEALMNKK